MENAYRPREEFFYRPQTLGEVIPGKTVIPVRGKSRSYLVDLLDELDDAAVVLLQDPPIDFGPYPPEFRHAANFLKRGPEVHLRLPSSQSACRESHAPVRLRRDAVERMDPEGNYSGFVWRSFRDRRKRKVHLDDCLSGGKLFAFSEHSPFMKDKIRVRRYAENGEAQHIGGTYVCEVPSRSSDRTYKFRLIGVPLVRSPGEYNVWTNLSAEGHDCELSVHRFTFRDAPHQVTFCAHHVAAYFQIAKEQYPVDRKLMLQPFPLMTQEMVSFWNKLRTQVLLEAPYMHPRTARPYTRKRFLNMAEREVFLHNRVAQRKADATLFARRKLREYDWG